MPSGTSLSFAQIEWTRWFFALRIWASIMLALGIAFWLELDGASSAGVCVAILALQTRGQMLEKAIYRVLGTIVGGIAAIVITDVFLQTRDLYVIAYSAWLGLCVFAAGFLDGNRAYGAVLCGYTVSIVAVQHIDMPEQVFSAAVDRGAAIVVGIAAIAFVNTVPSVPEITSSVVQRVHAARANVRAFTTGLLGRGQEGASDAEAARLLVAISDRHAELGPLALESVAGASRAAAARAVAVALVGEIVTARLLATMRADDDETLENAMNRRLLNDLDTYRRAGQDAARALEAGRSVPAPPGMPVYRSWENAARNGMRAFVASTMIGFAFVLIGWPATNLTWSFVGILVCLSATAPDPRVVARAAFIAMPASVLLAGSTLFITLDGSDAFPLLCAGLTPAIIGTGLLMTSPNPQRSAVGSLTMVFTLVVVGPSNPQTYDPSTYAVMSFLMILATVTVYTAVSTLFPVEDFERRAWVLRSASKAMRAGLGGNARLPAAEALLLDASRIATLSMLRDASKDGQTSDLATLFWLADLRFVAQRVWSGLDRLDVRHGRSFVSLRPAIRTALLRYDAAALRKTASALAATSQPLSQAIGEDIALTARLMEMAPWRASPGSAEQ